MFLLNGQGTDSINILDRGLQYGDGLFETIAVIGQQPLCWDQHLQRLLSGCEKLKIDFNDVDVLKSEVSSLCKNANISSERAVLKITITSGTGGRGYKRDNTGKKTTRLLAIYSWPNYPDNYSTEGIHAHLCSTRLGHVPELAGIKHLNRLEQVLARNEWERHEIMEGLLLDIDNNVIAGTMSNLFAIYPGRKLLTPDLSLCGIEGIVRQQILDCSAEYDYKSEIRKLSIKDIFSASEIFFCNSVAGIMPVKQLADHKYASQFDTNKIKQFLISREVIAPL